MAVGWGCFLLAGSPRLIYTEVVSGFWRDTMPISTQNNGFTLIEVLAALGLLAAGVLGMSALQQQVLTRNLTALSDSRARFLLQDIAERLRAGGSGDAYLLAYEAAAPSVTQNCGTQVCDSAALARWDLAQWRTQVEALPKGEGQVSNEASGTYVAAIRYGATQRELTLRFTP